MRLRACGALTSMALWGGAFACGVCVEDNVAATYDHAVLSKAQAQHHVVVFAAIDGAGPATAQESKARRAASRVRGIDRTTIRTAHDPAPAISFALDPGVKSPERAIEAVQEQANGMALKLRLLRVMS